MEKNFLEYIQILLAFTNLIYWMEFKKIKLLFNENSFLPLRLNSTFVLFFGLSSSLLLFFIPQSSWILLFAYFVVFLSIKKHFNGGSDALNVLLLLALGIASITDDINIKRGCLYFIAVQLVLSYFVAGFVKIKEPTWRNGLALQDILDSSTYPINPQFLKLFNSFQNRKQLSILISWSIILFELSAPLSFFSLKFCLFFLFCGFLFHFMNSWILGLNRFLLVWTSAYPALVFLSLQMSSFK